MCCNWRILKPRQIRKLLLPRVHVRATELRATMQSGDGFARIEQSLLVERVLHRMERLELRRRELHAHVVDFFDADAVLPGDRPPDFDRIREDLAAESFGALELAGLVRVVEDQR